MYGLIAILLVLAGLFQPALARAETIIGVAAWTGSGSADDFPGAKSPDSFARGLGDLMITDLSNLLNEAPQFKDCNATLTEVTRRSDVEKEVEFQQTPYVDPSTAAKPGQIRDPTHLVTGHVAPHDGGRFKLVVEVRKAPGGDSVYFQEREFGQEAAFDQTARFAEEILAELCKKKPVRIKAAYNDLVIDQVVCDIETIFTLRGTGATAGILFVLEPMKPDGGLFTVGGMAGGVPWSGDGFYALDIREGKGTIDIVGSWRITTPVGTFGDSGTIPGTVTPAESCPE